MWFSLISSVLMIDAVPENIPPVIALQQGLMTHFFQYLNPQQMQAISHGMPLTRICEWGHTPGQVWMECTDGVLRGITLKGRFQIYAIECLPNTIEEVEITGEAFWHGLNTRQLPVRARKVDLEDNMIDGSIDLSTLPPDLERLSVSRNSISGTVALTNLPRRLKSLNLSYNDIHQRTLYYNDLPPGFHAYIGHNRISGTRSITPGKKAPGGTFEGIFAWRMR